MNKGERKMIQKQSENKFRWPFIGLATFSIFSIDE